MRAFSILVGALAVPVIFVAIDRVDHIVGPLIEPVLGWTASEARGLVGVVLLCSVGAVIGAALFRKREVA